MQLPGDKELEIARVRARDAAKDYAALLDNPFQPPEVHFAACNDLLSALWAFQLTYKAVLLVDKTVEQLNKEHEKEMETNRFVHVFEGEDNKFYWNRVAKRGNLPDEVVADGGEGYSTEEIAIKAARRENPNLPIFVGDATEPLPPEDAGEPAQGEAPEAATDSPAL